MVWARRIVETPAARVTLIFVLLVFLFMMDRDPVSRLGWGEVTNLPWALQFVNPGWMPGDWLLNSPIGSQLLTGMISGVLAEFLGFFPASVVGRLMLYGFLAFTLGAFTRRLKIPTSFVTAALLGFAVLGQSIGAGEWVFRDLESKSFAYGFVFLGLYYWIDDRYGATGACLGAATSFHFLVGGWATTAVVILLVVDRAGWKALGRGSICFLIGGAVGLFNVVSEIFASRGTQDASWIIARFRVAHHVVPSYFIVNWEIRLALLAAVWGLLWWVIRLPGPARRIARFAAVTLGFFLAGIAIEPFDSEGVFLKLYPFRVGDTLFPLLTLLLSYFALERLVSRRILDSGLRILASLIFVLAGMSFAWKAQVPKGLSSVDAGWLEMCQWIHENTAAAAIVVVPPGRETFLALAQRPTVATFRQFPFQRSYVHEWYRRIQDLTGGETETSAAGLAAIRELDERYFALSTEQARKIKDRYGARYFLTTCESEKGLRLVHSNEEFCLYE